MASWQHSVTGLIINRLWYKYYLGCSGYFISEMGVSFARVFVRRRFPAIHSVDGKPVVVVRAGDVTSGLRARDVTSGHVTCHRHLHRKRAVGSLLRRGGAADDSRLLNRLRPRLHIAYSRRQHESLIQFNLSLGRQPGLSPPGDQNSRQTRIIT